MRLRPLATLLTLAAAAFCLGQKNSFEIKNHEFLLNGKPFQIVAGEMHYPRIPEEYWRHRLQMAKAMGLNTIAAYVFWNYHETEKGKFDFKGNADVARFIRIAKEEGLWVVLRPGPYVCAEWEFGGYPYWLLTEPGLTVRANNAAFLAREAIYLNALGKQLGPLQITHGGNILMVQVENEYGSYGSDKAYIEATKNLIRTAGFDVPLYSADGGSQMPAATIPGVLPGMNGGSGPDLFKTIDQFAPGGPYFVPEFYPGWLCHWGEKFPRSEPQNVANDFEWYLKNKVSVSVYMFHGGTNFGFWNGANFGGAYQPHITSYDYDAPLSEAGVPTAKFMAMRAMSVKYGAKLPEIPPTNPIIKFPPVDLNESTVLSINLPVPILSEQPKTMESIGQGYGFILYRTTIRGPVHGKLLLKELRDYAVVMLDGKPVGTLDRRRKQRQINLDSPGATAQLDILVENGGRINYGGELPNNLHGITESVELAGKRLAGWQTFSLPMNDLKGLKFNGSADASPSFFRGHFNLKDVGDTWLDMRGWNKGVVWINGHNLGRYWWIGPQQALYCPGPWLKRGKNEMTVFELSPSDHRTVEGLDHEILDDPRPESPLRAPRPKLDHTPAPTDADVMAFGDLPDGNAQQGYLFAQHTKRYLCFEATSSQSGQDFCALAEIWLLGLDNKPLDRAKWKVIYADSEEISAEDGSADNLIDDDPATFWHSVWSAEHSGLPHRVVIDLGEPTTFGGVQLLPRQGSKSGLVKGFRLYASDTPF